MTRVISIYGVTRRARAAHIVKSTRVTRIEIFNQVLIKIMIHMTLRLYWVVSIGRRAFHSPTI